MRALPPQATALLISIGLLAAAPSAHATEPTIQECLGASERSIALRREFKLRAAKEQLLVCAAASCPVDIRKECAERVDEINAAIPTIVFEAKDAAGADLSAVRVTMDGQPFAERLEGTASAIDPGSHSFRFESAGAPAVEMTFVIREGEKGRRERIVMQVNQVSSDSAGASEVSKAPAKDTHEAKPNPLPTIGLVAGGAGVLALGIGSVFGLKAKSKNDQSNENGHCDATGCDDHGLELRDDALNAAHVSTAFFIVGGVLAAGGVTLYLVGKSHRDSSSASVGVSPLGARSGGGLLVHGDF